jgi:alpha-1,2-mannosyltransferase
LARTSLPLRWLGVAVAVTLLSFVRVLDLVVEPVVRVDFKSFFLASRAAALGQNVYDVRVLERLVTEATLDGVVFPYIYPPLLSYWLGPASSLPPLEAQRLWFVVTAIALGVAAAALASAFTSLFRGGPARDRRIIATGGLLALLAVCILPVRHNVFVGQVNAIVLAFIALSMWAHQRRSDLLSGSLLAVAALIKTTPVLFVLWFIAQRRYRAVAAFAAACVVLAATTLPLGAWSAWILYVQKIPGMGHGSHIPGLYDPRVACNFAPTGFFARVLNEPGAVRPLSLLVAAALCLTATWFAWKSRAGARRELALALFCPAMILASPLTYVHHVLYLAPALVIWLEHASRQGRTLLCGMIVVLTAIASTDFASFWQRLSPDDTSWLVLSANLFALLALYLIGVFLLTVRRRGSAEASAVAHA